MLRVVWFGTVHDGDGGSSNGSWKPAVTVVRRRWCLSFSSDGPADRQTCSSSSSSYRALGQATGRRAGYFLGARL